MGKKKLIGLQMYTLRDFLKTPADMAKTLARVRKIGYEYVQISGFGTIESADLRALLDKNKLKAIGSHTGLAAMRENFKKVVDDLHALGIAYVAIPHLDSSKYTKAIYWSKEAKSWNAIGKAFKKEGITLQYHNHEFEFVRFGDKTALDIIFESTDPEYLQAELDLHWVVRGGGCPIEWIYKMKGRMDQVHLKDMTIWQRTEKVDGNDKVLRSPVMAEIGHGNLPWSGIFKALNDIGCSTWFVEQDSCPITNDPFKSVAMSFNYITKK